MALTWEDINSKVNPKILPSIADTVYKSSPTFVRVRSSNGQRFDGGTKIRQPIGYAELNGGPFSRSSTLNTDYVETDTAFEVVPKYYYVNVTLYGTDDVLAKGPEMAVDFVSGKLTNAAGKMAKLIGTDLFLDGLGVGSAAISVDGLAQWIDDGNTHATVGGLTRSDLGVSNGTVSQGANGYVASMASGFTLKGVQKAFGSAWFGNQHVDLIISDQNSWDHFWNKMQPQQRYMNEKADVATVGFAAFNFNGAQVTVDQYCPSGQMFGLNTRAENLLFFTSTQQLFQFGFTGFKEAQNTINRAGQYLWAGNVVLPNPRYHFRLTNIPTLS